MTLIYSCHWKTPCTFLLVKEKTWKRIFNTNSELSQNRTEKQIMQSKTIINWLFKDIWSWLKNWRFSTVVKVYYIVNYCHKELHFKEVELFYILFKCSSHLQHKCLEYWKHTSLNIENVEYLKKRHIFFKKCKELLD